ncbi:hypothetical protein Fmac_025342 [Flemingia macrophylla]|uniref:Uncharacterized protein n=1 Tax=Flemingia macrophylla TaxID=520843 RepID=A0ABD1LS05_9FABA
MAEGVLFDIIGKLIGKLGSMVAENWRMKDDLERLTENMTDIKAVVLDAEEQQGTNHQLQVWLDKLKDALDDADNLLDDFSTQDKKHEVMTNDCNCIKEVCLFFSSLLFSFQMAPRVRDIGKRLEALNVDRKSFKLTSRSLEERVVKKRETHSLIRKGNVIGREKEKKDLVELLLNTDVNMKENVAIISIVGIGGLGKTALAQLLFNDEAVQGHFELKMWVCVSDVFDVKNIAKQIIQSNTNEMERVQQELRKKIDGRKYLLVLDDIWNENRETWRGLMTLLMGGAKGSKIIVTTRSKKVAKITGTSSPFFLKGLDEEQDWKLFSESAFGNEKEPENQTLVSIGKDIVKKCSGVPLSIRTVGGLMYSMETENDWLNFKDKDLIKIDEHGSNGILQIIKLSYDHLPMHLKRCFAFCSLFPKDCQIERIKLIRLWVANGFVQSSNESMCLEDVGNEYFMNLVDRSFFQELRRSIFDDILDCKMHDLMHDMATFVSRNNCLIVKENGQRIDRRTQHLSFGFPLGSLWHIPTSLLKANKLRTLLLPQHVYENFYSVVVSLDESACNFILSSLEQLRVLDLSHLHIKMLSSCFDTLKHLRYLDLSFNKQIEVLPMSITKLYNLQTLLLEGCSTLRELPNNLWKLTSLQHLELEGCENLNFMPRGIGQLSNLETLSLFVLDKKFKQSGGPSELKGLNCLRGSLEIKGLECLRDNPSEVEEMDLMGKSNLKNLTLTWDNEDVADNDNLDEDYLILQGLLHHNINFLSIQGFGGVSISSTINPFKNLFCMSLVDCMRLQYLPPLHLLLHVKIIILSDLPCLEWINDNSTNDNSSTFFPSLQRIFLENLDNLKGWCRCSEEGKPIDCCHRLKSVERFTIINCPNLISFPPHNDIDLVSLNEVNEKILHQAIYDSNKVQSLEIKTLYGLKSLSKILQHLSALRELSISNCEELDPCNDEEGCYSMQWKHLTNLCWLKFDSIPKMEFLPDGLQHITTLRNLNIRNCHNLRCIPKWITSLRWYEIRRCPNVTSLPEGVKVLEK